MEHRRRLLFEPAAAAAAISFFVAAPAFAQSDGSRGGGSPPSHDMTLIDLDTPALPARGGSDLRLDLRGFSDSEGVGYGGLGLAYGVKDKWAAVLRGVYGVRADRFVATGDLVRHGGSDVEIALKRALGASDRVAALVGVGIPSTPARQDAALTLGLMADAPLTHCLTGYVDSRAILLKGNSIGGIGVGARLQIATTAALIGDYTFVVSGQNTRQTSDGSRRRTDVYGAALRFARPGDDTISLDLGYTKATGATTGFSLTPGLGGAGAIYVGLNLRR